MRRIALGILVVAVPLAVLAGPADEAAKGPDPYATGAAVRATGGPDDFGYSFIDSTEAGGPAYSWVDISATGTAAITGYSDDSVAGPFPIGFTFNFYGTDYTQFWVQSNGSIGFASFSYDLSNNCLPTTDLNGTFLAPLWDDLVCGSGPPGTIYYETLGTAPNRYLVIQFHEVRYFGGDDSDPIEFEVILYEGSNNIVYQYADLTNASSSHNGGVSATIGIQGDSGASPVHHLEYACNPATALTVPLAVLFTAAAAATPTPYATPVPGVPSLTPWGLAALLLTLAGVAVLLIRRRG